MHLKCVIFNSKLCGTDWGHICNYYLHNCSKHFILTQFNKRRDVETDIVATEEEVLVEAITGDGADKILLGDVPVGDSCYIVAMDTAGV